MASNANINRLSLEGQLQNSGEGCTHRNRHLYFQGDNHMILMTCTWLFCNKLSNVLMSWRERHCTCETSVFRFECSQWTEQWNWVCERNMMKQMCYIYPCFLWFPLFYIDTKNINNFSFVLTKPIRFCFLPFKINELQFTYQEKLLDYITLSLCCLFYLF